MATTLYFHSDLSSVGGSLPEAEQSTQDTEAYIVSSPEPGPGIDMSSTHRLMDDTQGSSENDAWFTANGDSNTVFYDFHYTYMVAQFVSEELSAGGIAADDWTMYLDATGGDDSGFAAKLSFSVYLWRPSTDTKITSIYDEDDAFSGVAVANNSALRAEYFLTRAGAAATAQAGDVIVVEIWTWTRSVGTGPSELYIFYDTGTDGRIVAPDLPFGPPPEPPPPIPQVGVFDPHLDPQAWF